MINIIVLSIIFITYVVFIQARYGILPSISESFYKLPGWQWIFFTLFTWGLGFPLILLERDILLTLAGVSLMFLGTVGAFKMDNIVKWMHNGFSFLAILFCFAFLLKNGFEGTFVGFGIFMTIIIMSEIKNVIWWIEIGVFVSIIIGLIKVI